MGDEQLTRVIYTWGAEGRQHAKSTQITSQSQSSIQVELLADVLQSVASTPEAVPCRRSRDQGGLEVGTELVVAHKIKRSKGQGDDGGRGHWIGRCRPLEMPKGWVGESLRVPR
jgi:hypothetical protein